MTAQLERVLPVAPPSIVSMRASDGCRLDADVYRPAAAGRFPVLLMRQPYGRRIASTICYAHPRWYAARGYVVVVQDVRGRGTSEGTFDLFAHEARDGAETIAWAAQLDVATGDVGMYGFSYQGGTQLLAAAQSPPALKALAPAMVGWDLRRDVAYENGAFCLKGGLGWALQLAGERARRAGDAEAYARIAAAARALPLDEPVAARPALADDYRAWTHYADWLDRAPDDPYWVQRSPAAEAAALAGASLPMLFVGGWYDSHLRGTLAAYRELVARGHERARLVVGPWAHWPWHRRVGAFDFGPDAAGAIDQLQLRWFDRWLKGDDNGVDHEPPVQLFDLGAKTWRRFAGWPSASHAFRLEAGGRVALDERDGTLREVVTPADDDTGEAVLVHDPWRPAPAVGGSAGTPPGPVDRRAVDARPDVLTFTTAPLDTELRLAGDVCAELLVEADVPDVDVACTLSRVGADGVVMNLADGYARLAAPRDPAAIAVVPMRATCATIAPGEALRLSIAAAAFPAYPVNPGTGADPTRTAQIDAQIVTLRVRTTASVLVVALGG